MANLKSPFQCGGSAKTFPALKIPKRITLRVDDTDATAKIYITTDGTTPSSTNAQYFLNAGESIELAGCSLTNASQISVIDGSDDPLIYFGIE